MPDGRRPLRPAPPPLDVDSTRVILIGTALWFAAFVVLVLFRGALGVADTWLWATLAGGVLGLLGLALSLRQRRPRG